MAENRLSTSKILWASMLLVSGGDVEEVPPPPPEEEEEQQQEQPPPPPPEEPVQEVEVEGENGDVEGEGEAEGDGDANGSANGEEPRHGDHQAPQGHFVPVEPAEPNPAAEVNIADLEADVELEYIPGISSGGVPEPLPQ